MDVVTNRTKGEILKSIGNVLLDVNRPMKERFRALFTLKNIGGELSVRLIEKCFSDSSSLLKHECAYCLGQMQNALAVSKLKSILQDVNEEPIVRHEAGEALAAIGLSECLHLLKQYSCDAVTEIAETCQLALERIAYFESSCNKSVLENPYNSVDPAPPLSEDYDIEHLQNILLDESSSLFLRYRAMFSLRNLKTTEAALVIAKGLKCRSALFRHEIAFVLGQMQNNACEQYLSDVLCDLTENEMVRHECAEALGAIATPSSMQTLRHFLNDEKRVVRESCEVALDICEYENSKEFQYADTLLKVQ